MPMLAYLTISALGWVDERDQRLMRRVNGWRAPKWLRMWMMAATRGGDGWLWYAMAGVVVLFGGEHRGPALASAATATGVGIALFMKLKRMIGRKRPCALEPHCWAKLLPPDQFSFPSGHTITAFAVAISLSRYYPEMEPGLLFCAVSIAASRVVLGMHYLSDVVAGSVIGTALALSAVAFFN